MANISAPTSDKRACRSSGGICGVDSRAALIEPLLTGLCINMMHAVALQLNMYTVRIIKRYFAYGEYIRTLRLTSELVDLRVGYAKWIQ